MQLTNDQAHRIAEAAIEADQLDVELLKLEQTGARLAIREARTARDAARAKLADAIASTEQARDAGRD
jgi:hypothetical protein